MDARPADFSLSYDGAPPLLVTGTSEAAIRRGLETASLFGARAVSAGLLEDSPARLRQQVSSCGIWIEVDADPGNALDELLAEVDARAAGRAFGSVLSVASDVVDLVGEHLFDARRETLIEANPVERIASLSAATAFAAAPHRAHDVSRDSGTERLRQLSDEVSRIAATLARLSTVPASGEPELRKPVQEDVPDVPVETVRSVIRARRLRSRFFPEELFADPAWDMLLDLLQAEIAQLRVPVSSLCIAAAVPATTALRWLKNMTDKGIFVRRADPRDGRRVFVELSAEASLAMRRYFAEVGRPATA